MSLRLPTTARIALLAVLLALLSNLALLGFVHLRTRDDALAVLRQRVGEEAAALADVHVSGGAAGLADAIDDAIGPDDPQLVAALADARGRVIAGNLRTPIAAGLLHPAGFRIVSLGTKGEAGLAVRRVGRDWLIAGRGLGERLALQRTLERSLLLAIALSLLFGLVTGAAIARYVGRRVRAISDVVDAVGAGDLARRVGAGGTGDAFAVLSSRIDAMLDRIEALMSELRLLGDSLAHDLRSPIGRLRARIERALVATEEAQRDVALEGVIAEADALTRMLTTVIEISRSEAMAGRERFVWLDPAELTAELAEMYEPLAEEAGVTLDHAVEGVLLPFRGHRQLLAQALSNLIDNALNYGAAGGAIRLFAEQRPDGLRLGVADGGPGIGAGDRAEARRRFGRLDASRSAPGAGLGLSLVESVAHLHGGRLELDDGRPGLRATIVLPPPA